MTNWELGVWSNGDICLYYEDQLYGQDVVITLNADGTATISETDSTRHDVSAVEVLRFLREFAQAASKKAEPLPLS